MQERCALADDAETYFFFYQNPFECFHIELKERKKENERENQRSITGFVVCFSYSNIAMPIFIGYWLN